LRQVHGDRIVAAGAENEPEADGQWTQEPGHVLVVGVADCVPVFLWDAGGRRMALVHAGWRGTALGVVARAVESLRRAGSIPADLWMAMGPSIGPCCYEVGGEVADRFPAAAVHRDGEQSHLDLRQANRLVARSAGVAAERILADPPCTACSSELFYSHRRLGPRTGRMWAVAWIRGDAA
jgi:YfiH family protein